MERRILIIDDDRSMCDVLDAELKRRGFEVTTTPVPENALHRLSDLRSAGDDGSRQQRLAQGLLAEASTTVIYRQHAQEVPDTAEALGLSSTARERIARLPPGVALWCVGGRCFEVRHILSDQEWALIDTDQAMGARRQTTPPESDEGQLETAASVAP